MDKADNRRVSIPQKPSEQGTADDHPTHGERAQHQREMMQKKDKAEGERR